MPKLLADENINGRFLKALASRYDTFDIVRAQDVGLQGIDDPAILEWAAVQSRILLTHDRETMVAFALRRIRSNMAMPGIIVINEFVEIARAVDDTGAILLCLSEQEIENQVLFVPM